MSTEMFTVIIRETYMWTFIQFIEWFFQQNFID